MASPPPVDPGLKGFDKLSPVKQKLLLARLEQSRRQREAAGEAGGSISPSPLRGNEAAGEVGFPLSFSQRRLWFLDRLEPGSASYVLIDALRLSGRLSVPVLTAALSEIVRRHEALRTVFEVEEGGEPVQRIVAPRPVAVPVVDLAGLDRGRAGLELQRIGVEEARRPFDLPRGPHLRALLVRLAAEEHGALLALHHIVSDGWSMGVLVRELTALYGAFAAGRPSPLSELSLQYPDFADWQRRRLSGEGMEELLGYWRRQLAGMPFTLDLPADRPRPAVQTVRGASRRAVFPPDRLGTGGETLFMVLLAAFAAVLSRHAGQEDLCIGSPVANRNRLETEDLIGFFVNMLALRIDLREAPSFTALLDRVKQATLGAYAHQDLPFERLVEELQPVRDLSRTPIFQVTLALQNAPAGELRLPGLSLSSLPVEIETSLFDLGLEAVETPAGLALDWRFNTDLFDAATLESLARRFEILLAAATADPDRPLDGLPLLSEAESRQLLEEWNAPPPLPEAAAAGARLHDLLAAAAAATPEAEALVAGEERLTYAELAARAASLALRLRELGVRPEERVAVSLGRSAEAVVSFLAVLQAGGVYMPIDPAYPEARRTQLLRGSGARLLVTEDGVVAVGDPAPEGKVGEALADGLAYVLYTSGSTGDPKGVAVPHRSAVAHVEAVRQAYGLSAADRVLLFASFGFDVSVEQIFATFAAGAALVLRGDEVPLPERFSGGLSDGGISLVNLPTAYWHQWVGTGTAGAADTLRLLIVGGEAMTSEAGRQWLAAGPPGVVLFNGYGPTEAVVTPTLFDLAEGWGAAATVPIGRPVGHRRGHVLDPKGRLVPVGVAGELFLGGILARGYLDRPALTAERFVPDPWSREPGDRLYRTGDLVRRRAGGVLEYLGRTDGQVKVRGFRIETGEVEAVLAAHPEVRQAAVVAEAGDTGPAGATLVAYVVPAVPAGLRAFVAERLPAPFVPSAFVALPALPLTAHGKVDRRRLAEAGGVRPSSTASRPPRTPVEEIVAGVWEDVLSLPPGRIGADDDFFERGGHSLLATQVASRLGAAFGTDVPLRTLFEASTVAALAQRLEQRTGEAPAGPPAPPLVPVPRDGRPLPLSFAQQRLWFLYRLDPESPVYNMDVPLRLAGRLDPAALAAAFTALAARHEALRTTFAELEDRSGPVQIIHAAAPVPLPLVDLEGLPEPRRRAEAERLAGDEARRPFDLERGPLLRTGLLRLAGAEHALLITLHHSIADGWSMGILTREAVALYEGFAQGRPGGLPALPLQYADFAVWQRERLRSGVLAAELEIWKQRLAGLPPLLELPTDRPRPAVQTFRGATLPAGLTPELTTGLALLSRRTGATLFMGLLAAFQALLARYSGQTDFSIGTPVAGRSRRETEGLIGFFVNALVLRADLGGDRGRGPGLRELIARARETALSAFAHPNVPFEKLVEELRPERSLSHPPLFQVLLALQNAPFGALAVPGLAFEPLPAEADTSRFDLSLSLAETGGGLGGMLELRTDLFDVATVRRLLLHLERLVAAALADPDRPWTELPLLSEGELGQLVDEGRGSPAAVPSGAQSLAGLLRANAGRSPDAPAVLFGEESLAYGELAARVERLARRLAAAGVGPEVRVGICLDRSVELVVAVLAVSAAGGAWVPLDPAVPQERLSFFLADAGASLVICGAATEEALPELPAGVRRWRIEDAEARDLPESSPLPAGPLHLAYVLYTSGSTGRPKGVMVPRGGVANLGASLGRAAGMGPGSRMLQFASPGFDASVAEIAMALAAGAALCLAPREDLLPGTGFVRLLRDRQITHVILPPPALAVMPFADLPDLECLMVAGEECPPALAALWGAGRRLVNAYGPTEGTVCASWAAIVDPAQDRLPIGRNLAGVEAFLLDPHGGLVPTGVPGELWIGGLGLARGYAGRPDLTAERFVPHAWSAEPGARLYRTGDLVRRRPSGGLELLSRIDRQLKIRGVRVEPGEVEALLAAHEAVRQVAVAPRPGPGGLRLVAWVVPAGPASAAPSGAQTGNLLRAFLRERLPEPMVPAAFVLLDEMPLTSSGKVDRNALPMPQEGAATVREPGGAPAAGLEGEIAAVWQEVLNVEAVGLDDNFFDLGGHSLLLVELQSRLKERLGAEVALLDLFRFPNVRSLARRLARPEERGTLAAPERRAADSRAVAIVGMAGRFPGAADLEQHWRNLREGVESIRFFSPEELRAVGVDPETPGLVPAAGVLDGADLFDAPFFDVSPREAQLMDPQQRVFLECAAEALERAGYGAGSPSLAAARVGVFAGTGSSSYALQNLFSHPAAAGLEVSIANETDFLATRVAYKLDLRGPALTVQTACSTSLVAVHLACKALLDGECDLALAGGVTIQFPQTSGYLRQEGGIASPDGHNRAFDARAAGTVGGAGAGAVVLKPLSAALADGDTVHAVIKATALNNDGAGKIGFTAPSEDGQARVIAEAQALAGIGPETVRYVEAHGSATPLGDPIEVAALTRAFRAAGDHRIGACAIGSVKSNVGHTGSAAGIAGLLKAVLALEHREIPPSLHFETPNPQLDLASSPFYVAAALEPWPAEDGAPRRAGVSSFGLGGTNAHAVLEEAPALPPSGPSREWQLVSFSTRTGPALEAATGRLAEHLASREVDLADAAFTLHLGRRAFEHRRVLVCRGREEAAAALRDRDPQRVLTAAAPRGADRPVAFVFSGVGEQYPGMAAGLYRSEPGFREAFDRCAAAFAPHLDADLRELLFPDGGAGEEPGGGLDLKSLLGRSMPPVPAQSAALDSTPLLQPALFALEYALAELWQEWGVSPQALLGYSLGEYGAAHLAGVFSLEDAAFLVAERARLAGGLPPGGMLAVSLSEEEVRPWLEPFLELDLTAVNGPHLSVAAGPLAAIAGLEERLAAAGQPTRRLRTGHAFHSAMMRPAAERLADLAGRVDLRPPRIPCLSNVTGTWLTAAQATDPAYWGEHLCRTVRFGDGLAELWREPGRVLLELGPGGSLAALALQHPAAAAAEDPVAVASLPSAHDRQGDAAFVLGSLGKLWLAGAEVDWRGFHRREHRRRVELPAYPFERQRYWLEGGDTSAVLAASRTSSEGGLYLPGWRRSAPLPPAEGFAGRWLIFDPAVQEHGLGARIAERLRLAGAEVVTAVPGERFEPRGSGCFALDPARGEDYADLLWALDGLPDGVVHLWAADDSSEQTRERGFLSLLSLVHALALRAPSGDAGLRALVVSSGAERVTAADPLRPDRAPLAAFCQALPREMPGVVCRAVDVDRPQPGSWQEERQAEALLAELAAAGEDGAAGEPVAYRGGERWVRSYEPVATSSAGTGPQEGGVLLAGSPGELLQEAAAELERQGTRAVLVDLDLGAPSSPLALLRREDAAAALAEAALRLEELALRLEAGPRPGRVILLGSLEAHAAEPGAVLRAAVQQWAGAFAEERFAAGAVPWTAVAWDHTAAPEPGEVMRRLLALGPVSRLAVSSETPAAWRRRGRGAEPRIAADEGTGLHARPNLRNAYVAPRTGTESAVAGIWQQLLGLESVGVYDSFFDLGGDSLVATQVMTRIRESFGVQVALPDFFELPTPAALAERVEAGYTASGTQEMVDLIAHIDDLSPEEVERLLAERGVSVDDFGGET